MLANNVGDRTQLTSRQHVHTARHGTAMASEKEGTHTVSEWEQSMDMPKRPWQATQRRAAQEAEAGEVEAALREEEADEAVHGGGSRE